MPIGVRHFTGVPARSRLLAGVERVFGQVAGLPPVEMGSSQAGVVAPFAPSGEFVTWQWPEVALDNADNLSLTNAGDLFVSWPLYHSTAVDNLWQARADPVWYANKTALAVSPNFARDSLLMAGTDYGLDALRLSHNGGRSWTSPAQPINAPVRGIVFSPAFALDRTAYVVLNAPGGLKRSTDGGQHWHDVAGPTDNGATAQLVLSPYYYFDGTLFARLGNGILWRSSDAGASWARADTGLGTEAGNPVWHIAVAPLGGGGIALVAASQAAVVISLDLGTKWYLIDWKVFSYISVPPDFAYSLTVYGIEPYSQRLLKTTDLGDSWQEPLRPHEYIESVVYSPNYGRDQTVYASGTLGVWRSTDGGLNWWQPWGRLADDLQGYLVGLQISPNYESDRTMVALISTGQTASRYHVLRSTDGSRTWASAPVPVPGNGEGAMAFSPAFNVDHKLFFVSEHMLLVTLDLGQTWSEVTTALPIPADMLAVSPAYAVDQTLFVAGYTYGLYRSTDGGTNWSLISDGIPPYFLDLDISTGYLVDSTIFVSIAGGGIFRSSNAGASWVPLNMPVPIYSQDFRVALSPAFAQDQTLFIGGRSISSGGGYRSQDGGNTWFDFTGEEFSSWVVGLAVSPRFAQDRTLVMATSYRGAFISEDAGETWFPLTGLPHIQSLMFQLDLTYEHDKLLPVAGLLNSVFRYRWPVLTPLPSTLAMSVMTGTTGVVSYSLALPGSTGWPNSPVWTAEDNRSWLTVSPVSGTLPGSMNLQIDADSLPGNSSATLTVRRYLSLRNVETTQMQLGVFWATDRLWLPIAAGGAPVPSQAAMHLGPEAPFAWGPFGLPELPPFVWPPGHPNDS